MTPSDRLRLLIATGLGSGRVPIAPGTVGSLLALPLVALLWRAGGTSAVVTGTAIVIVLGFWSAGIAESHFGRRDPGAVVIDEIAGQMVSLLFLAPSPTSLATGFLLFRIFDILKPFPARRLESLPGASGIMADDLMAAVYANLLLQICVRIRPEWFTG